MKCKNCGKKINDVVMVFDDNNNVVVKCDCGQKHYIHPELIIERDVKLIADKVYGDISSFTLKDGKIEYTVNLYDSGECVNLTRDRFVLGSMK